MPPSAAMRGQRGLARVTQLAVDELALDLEPDDEEEDGHQPVVDPLVQVEVEDMVPSAIVTSRGPEVAVRVLPR